MENVKELCVVGGVLKKKYLYLAYLPFQTATMENLVKKINNGDYGNKKSFVILFESNQPYIERQTLATQASIDNILKQSGLDKKGYSIKKYFHNFFSLKPRYSNG